MIIQCKSCNKKFTVPDSAITASGRLVQCSACGNKWTQYPIKKEIEKPIVLKKPKTKKPIKKKAKKKSIDTYSPEYLQKKHGIKIIDPSSITKKNSIKGKKKELKKPSFGFYNYLITLTIFLIFFIGLLNLNRYLLINKFPQLAPQIDYFFETLNNIKTLIFDIISNY